MASCASSVTSRSGKDSTPGPDTRHLANALMSSTPTCAATLRHSRPTGSNQRERRNDQSSTASTPSGANQFARSQPNFWPNTPPSAFSRSWQGAVRNGRAAGRSSSG